MESNWKLNVALVGLIGPGVLNGNLYPQPTRVARLITPVFLFGDLYRYIAEFRQGAFTSGLYVAVDTQGSAYKIAFNVPVVGPFPWGQAVYPD